VFDTAGYALATQAAPLNLVVSPRLYIATGPGTIARSSNGTVWSSVASPFTTQTSAVAYNGSLWVAGGSGTYSVAYSTDGIAWTGVSIAGVSAIASVAWGAGRWVAVGTGTNTLAVSADGIAWTPYAPGVSGFFDTSGNGVAWGGGIWVAAGSGTGIAYSANGIEWSEFVDPVFTSGAAVAFNGTIWVAVGTGPNSFAYSFNGFIWIGLGTLVFSGGGNAVAYNGSRWVAVGQGATNTIAYSLNGIDWIGCGKSVLTTAGTGVTWSNGLWIATGIGANTLATSVDGIHWVGQGSSTFPTGAYSVAANSVLPVTSQTLLQPTTIRWRVAGLCVVPPTKLQKPDHSPDGWNASASSIDGYVNSAFLQFRSNETIGAYMMGLSENPTASSSYTNINYAFFVNVNSVIEIYELGSQVATIGTPYVASTRLQIVYDGTSVIYKVNSVPVRTVARLPGAPLFLACSMKKPGTTVQDIEFHELFEFVPATPAPSRTAYAISQIPGITIPQFQPIQFPLTSNITPCRFTLNTTLSGTIQSPSTIFYADIFLNSTLFGTTNTVSPVYGAQPSTYALYLSTVTTQPAGPGDTLYIQYKSTRSDGDLYLYGSYLYSDAVTTTSTCLVQAVWNPVGIDHFEFFHTNGNSGLQTSQLQLQVSPFVNDTTSYVNSNYGIEMNRGYISWANALNAITIQNQFNDIRTRSVMYTGAIFNPSDPLLKTDIACADTRGLYDTIAALPLKRYALSPEYMRTFGLEDRMHIGVLASDVAELIPEAVRETEFGYCGISTLNMVEKNALQYTHFGATQALMERVSTLTSVALELKTRFKIP